MITMIHKPEGTTVHGGSHEECCAAWQRYCEERGDVTPYVVAMYSEMLYQGVATHEVTFKVARYPRSRDKVDPR